MPNVRKEEETPSLGGRRAEQGTIVPWNELRRIVTRPCNRAPACEPPEADEQIPHSADRAA